MSADPSPDVSSYFALSKNGYGENGIDPATRGYIHQQTSIRIKDPVRSLDFYIKKLGYHLICDCPFPQYGFTAYYIAYLPDGQEKLIPNTYEERWNMAMTTRGCIELTWNHGTEKEEPERIYNTGNSDTVGTTNGEAVRGGFKHLGITVADVYECAERMQKLGVTIKKSPNGGTMKGLLHLLDPDGYTVEVQPQGPYVTKPVDCCGAGL